MKARLLPAVAFLLALAPAGVFAQQGPQPAAAPVTFRATGTLKLPDGQPRTGWVNLIASIYDSEQNQTPLWSETHYTKLDDQGHYDINVGGSTGTGVPRDPFLTDRARWIGVALIGDLEQPRVPITTVPYAVRAGDADSLGGRSAADFVLRENLLTSRGATMISNSDQPQSTFTDFKFTSLTTIPDTLSVTGFGQHSFQASGTGGNILKIVNSAAGSGNYSQMWLGTNEAPYVGVLSAFSSTYSSGNASDVASGVKLTGDYAGGLTLGALHPSGSVRFFAGGNVQRAELSSAGVFSVNGRGIHSFSATGTGGNIFALRNSTAGAGNYSQIWLGTDEAPYVGVLSAFSSLFTVNGSDQPSGVKLTGDYAGGLSLGALHASGAVRFYTGGKTERMRIDNAGNVGIGTSTPTAKLDVVGNINVSGNINAKYQDIAEWVDAATDLDPGTVVTIDPAGRNRVKAASRAYDTSVAGVVSPQPGLTLGEKLPGQEMVATLGRVIMKVDASFGAIKVGDLLVTSRTPGHAMRSKPLMINGHAVHRTGTLVAKALEPWTKGKGEILVLLMLQ